MMTALNWQVLWTFVTEQGYYQERCMRRALTLDTGLSDVIIICILIAAAILFAAVAIGSTTINNALAKGTKTLGLAVCWILIIANVLFFGCVAVYVISSIYQVLPQWSFAYIYALSILNLMLGIYFIHKARKHK